jgi:hypothetical protein
LTFCARQLRYGRTFFPPRAMFRYAVFGQVARLVTFLNPLNTSIYHLRDPTKRILSSGIKKYYSVQSLGHLILLLVLAKSTHEDLGNAKVVSG